MRATEGLSACGRAAMMYAQHGWAVFPCTVGGKEPAVERGFQSATRSEVQIAKWWRRSPRGNVAIATGDASGLWVLDLDRKHPHCWDELRGLLESRGHDYDEARDLAHVVSTASGGEHWYFKSEGLAATIGAGLHGIRGIDWRCNGGYVVAPPSETPAGTYIWVDFGGSLPELNRAPTWLEDLLVEKGSGGEKPPIAELKGAVIYEGENRFRALQQMSGYYLAVYPDAEAAFCALVGWSWMHCRPPYEFDKVRSIFDGVHKQDRRNHPEREHEREQHRLLAEMLGETAATPEQIEEARRVNEARPVARAVRQAQHEEREAQAEETELDEESSTSEAREAAARAGLLTINGTQDPGFALLDDNLRKQAQRALCAMLNIRVARVIRYAGDPERYVLRLEGGIDIDLGSSATAAQATAVSVRLWDSRGVQLTKYACTKGWPTVRALLYALREDLDAELGLRDEAAELIRACYGRGRADIFDRGEPHEPASWSAWMESGKGWLEDGTLFLPWTHLRRAAETINRMATDVWIRRRLQAIEGEGRRIQLRDPMTGQVVRVRAYAIPSSGDLA